MDFSDNIIYIFNIPKDIKIDRKKSLSISRVLRNRIKVGIPFVYAPISVVIG